MKIPERELDGWLAFGNRLADESRLMHREFQSGPPDVEFKADNSVVTAMDKAIESRLRELITTQYPDHGIIGEEQEATNPGAEINWVLDPIDGTAAFIAGMPVYGTLIALAMEGTPILGIVDIPAVEQRWRGASGRPTTKNGIICRTRKCRDMSKAVLINCNPDILSATERPALDSLRKVTARRIYGGASLAYGLLAEGRVDLAVDSGFMVHDFAAHVPVIQGAGGKITDWAGRPLTLESGRRILAAGDPALHREALEMITDLAVVP